MTQSADEQYEQEMKDYKLKRDASDKRWLADMAAWRVHELNTAKIEKKYAEDTATEMTRYIEELSVQS